jgi:MFS family permease
MRPGYMNTIMNVYSDMEPHEKRTFYLHSVYCFLEGIILGVFSLNEFVFIKSTGAGNFKLSLLFQLSVFVLPFSVFFTSYLGKVQKKQRLLFLIAIVTRLPLFLLLLFPRSAAAIGDPFYQDLFLWIFLMFYFASPFMMPVINHTLKSNYSPEKFGKLYSYSLSINQVMMLVTGLMFGRLLDSFPDAYIYAYPAMGVLGIISVWMINKIQLNREPEELLPHENVFVSMRKTLLASYQVLKTNKAFMHFQAAMMIYGVGFLMNQAVITLFFIEYLQLNYTESALYKGLPIAIATLSYPIFGVLIDRVDPRKFSISSFAFVTLFFILLIAAWAFPEYRTVLGYKFIYMLVAAYFIYGLFTGSMTLLWNIGSTYFAAPSEGGRYHSIHLSLTGIRGLISPALGVVIYTFAGFVGAFVSSIIMMIVAMLIMRYSIKKVKF